MNFEIFISKNMSFQLKKKEGDTVIALDVSGSTNGVRTYWSIVGDILKNNPNARVLTWGNQCDTIKRNDVNQLVETNGKTCNQGTYPAVVAPFLSHANHLILITDGEISDNEVRSTEVALSTIASYPPTSELHIISRVQQPNFSVLAPFVRRGTCTLFHNNVQIFNGSVNIDIPNITINDLMNNFEFLSKQVQFSNMGRNNHSMRDQLLVLRKKIIREQGAKFANELNQLIETICQNPSSHHEQIKNLVLSSLAERDNTVIDRIDKLVSWCNMENMYQLQEPGRIARAPIQQPVEMPEVQEDSGNFPCPISLDEKETPVLLLSGRNFLSTLDKDYANMALNCPFTQARLDNETLIKMVDHPIGCNAYIEMQQRNMLISPLSRNVITELFRWDVILNMST